MALIGPIQYRGLNTKTTETAGGAGVTGNVRDIPLGQMSQCDSFITRYGILLPRPAVSVISQQLNASSTAVFGLTSWVDAANYSQGNTTFAVQSQKVWSLPWVYNRSPAGTFVDVTGTAVLGSGYYQFAVLNNILAGFGGSSGGSAPFKVTAYNGSASNLGGTPPKGDVVRVVNNFMFVGRQLNSTSTFSTVSWSNVGDPETWTAGNSIDFRKNDGDRVVALGSIGTDLYIFKFNSIGRLSTTTLTLSGAVTLGPLTTVSTGLGAFSPNAVDNMGDGRIVFLGSDLRLHLFDGFSFSTLSDKALPEPNVQSSLDEVVTLTNAACVKCYPGSNQILVSFGVNGGTNARLYSYNYVDDFWGLWTGLNPSILSVVNAYDFTLPTSGYFNIQNSIIEGTNVGRIAQLDNNSVLSGASNDIDGESTGTATCIINVPLTGDYYDFIPRSMLLPIGSTASITGSPNSLIITFGYDGTFLASSSYTVGNATYPPILQIPIPQAKGAVGGVRPLSMQIKIENTGGASCHPFYLSDEGF